MNKTLVNLLLIVTLFAWFIIGGKKSAFDKILIIAVIIATYVAVRWMHGDTFEQMFAYFLK